MNDQEGAIDEVRRQIAFKLKVLVKDPLLPEEIAQELLKNPLLSLNADRVSSSSSLNGDLKCRQK